MDLNVQANNSLDLKKKKKTGRADQDSFFFRFKCIV